MYRNCLCFVVVISLCVAFIFWIICITNNLNEIEVSVTYSKKNESKEDASKFQFKQAEMKLCSAGKRIRFEKLRKHFNLSHEDESMIGLLDFFFNIAEMFNPNSDSKLVDKLDGYKPHKPQQQQQQIPHHPIISHNEPEESIEYVECQSNETCLQKNCTMPGGEPMVGCCSVCNPKTKQCSPAGVIVASGCSTDENTFSEPSDPFEPVFVEAERDNVASGIGIAAGNWSSYDYDEAPNIQPFEQWAGQKQQWNSSVPNSANAGYYNHAFGDSSISVSSGGKNNNPNVHTTYPYTWNPNKDANNHNNMVIVKNPLPPANPDVDANEGYNDHFTKKDMVGSFPTIHNPGWNNRMNQRRELCNAKCKDDACGVSGTFTRVVKDPVTDKEYTETYATRPKNNNSNAAGNCCGNCQKPAVEGLLNCKKGFTTTSNNRKDCCVEFA